MDKGTCRLIAVRLIAHHEIDVIPLDCPAHGKRQMIPDVGQLVHGRDVAVFVGARCEHRHQFSVDLVERLDDLVFFLAAGAGIHEFVAGTIFGGVRMDNRFADGLAALVAVVCSG